MPRALAPLPAFAAPFAVAVALAALLAAPAAARAEAWVAVSAGAAIPTGAVGGQSWSAGITGTLQGGYDLGPVGASLSLGVLTTRAGNSLSVTVYPMLLRLRARLPLGIAAPYAFGGVGIAPSRAQAGAYFQDATPFAAQAGGGVDVALGDMFFAGAEAAYQWTRPSFPSGTLDLNAVVIQALVGVRI